MSTEARPIGRCASAEKHRLASSLGGAREPAASALGESNGRAAIRGAAPNKATATALQYELKNGKALGSGRQ